MIWALIILILAFIIAMWIYIWSLDIRDMIRKNTRSSEPKPEPWNDMAQWPEETQEHILETREKIQYLVTWQVPRTKPKNRRRPSLRPL